MRPERQSPPPPDEAPDPKIEIGHSNSGIAPWSAFDDATEDVSELAFLHSVRVYNKMRNDDQLFALPLAFVLPIYEPPTPRASQRHGN